jgi:cellulose synthase/poly-beta-1,6-N-acetylglucosamine synthase-like glycosyltransferase
MIVLVGVVSNVEAIRYVILIAIWAVVYTWLLYPAAVWLLSRIFRRPVACSEDAAEKLRVSIILPVHNEEKCLAAKLQNCLSLQYPRELLEILVVSDRSTDATERIAAEFAARDPRIRLLRTEGRAGKSNAQNLAVAGAIGDVLFLTDANAHLRSDVLTLLVSNFADPKVGLATATLHLSELTNAIGEGQGLYWRYELFLRKAESELGILATASGAALAMRRSLFRPMQEMYGDDCILPLDVRLQGYRVLHDSRPVVFDSMPHSIEGELRARIRMTARNWTGTLSRPALLNPFRFPLTSWGLISHKLLRWLTPFLLLVIFLANSFLLFHDRLVALWLAQALFYLAAFAGWLRVRKTERAGIFSHPFSFCLANVGFFLGMIRAFRAKRIVAY